MKKDENLAIESVFSLLPRLGFSGKFVEISGVKIFKESWIREGADK